MSSLSEAGARGAGVSASKNLSGLVSAGVPRAGSLVLRFLGVLEPHYCNQAHVPWSAGPQCVGDDVDESRTWRQKPGGTNLSEEIVVDWCSSSQRGNSAVSSAPLGTLRCFCGFQALVSSGL